MLLGTPDPQCNSTIKHNICMCLFVFDWRLHSKKPTGLPPTSWDSYHVMFFWFVLLVSSSLKSPTWGVAFYLPATANIITFNSHRMWTYQWVRYKHLQQDQNFRVVTSEADKIWQGIHVILFLFNIFLHQSKLLWHAGQRVNLYCWLLWTCQNV